MKVEYTQKIRNAEIKQRRLGLGLTQKALAELAGVSMMTISALERFRPMSEKTIQKVATVLGASAETIFPAWLRRVKEVPTEISTTANLAEGQFLTLSYAVSQRLLSHDRDPSEIAETREEAEIVSKAMSHLRERDAEILLLRYGKGWRLKDISERFRISDDRVRQVTDSALRRLLTFIPKELRSYGEERIAELIAQMNAFQQMEPQRAIQT